MSTVGNALALSFLLPAFLLATGWQTEQTLFSGGQTLVEGSCARFPNTNTNICVVEKKNSNGTLDLYEVRSYDGGVTWSSATQVTNHSETEYDPFVVADAGRGRIWLLYSRTRFPANDLHIRYKGCTSCSWSAATTVIADGKNNWDASLLVLASGHLLALETIEGQDGNGPAQIRSIRSTNGGASWGAPVVIYNGTGEEAYPVALQKSDGVIHLMYRDTQYGPAPQIGQLWSSDNGYTWTGQSIFSYNFGTTQEFTFIGTQGGQNITVLARINGRTHHWQSWNNGVSFQGPYITTTSTSNHDAEFSLGCRGLIFSFGVGQTFKARRYDWYNSCN